MPIDYIRMVNELTADEGVRLTVYDDANSKPITRGTVVEGHPTIGIGRALDINGITLEEAKRMLAADLAYYVVQMGALPWYAGLDPVRQRVILNMRHQLGFAGVCGFHAMIGAIEARHYDVAATCMQASHWARNDSPARARRLAAMMVSGANPPVQAR